MVPHDFVHWVSGIRRLKLEFCNNFVGSAADCLRRKRDVLTELEREKSSPKDARVGREKGSPRKSRGNCSAIERLSGPEQSDVLFGTLAF